MKLYQSLLTFTLGLTTVGCAIAPGLQTYNIPSEGSYQTELGTQVNVIQISPDIIANLDTQQSKIIINYQHLFHTQTPIYRLVAGDVLSLQFWNYPEITPVTNNTQNNSASNYAIDQQGYILLPLVGRYYAAGKTLQHINTELKKSFARFLKNPDLIVRIVAYEGNRYSVQGNVSKAGEFTLNDRPVSIYTALGLAGGISELGDNTSIQLIRDGQTYPLNSVALEKAGYSLHKLLLQPNDTLYVGARQNQKIYVMGEASKNQAITLRDQGMSLSDVLGESLGIDPNSANASKIYILRNDEKQHTASLYHMNLSNLGDFSLANQFAMQKNDIIYIDATGLTRWQRIVNQIVPFANAAYSFDRVGQ
ncbi:MAG: hypothetical protein E6Q89_06415 [Bacteroidia bacterium]|nr:MAG: hypothetical protein E6Q89_06415 [Bacteroidia bacterium]